MQKVMVQIDWYTKIILTLIAVLLAGLLAKPYVAPKIVEADSDNVEVEGTVEVRGSYYQPYPVEVKVVK